MKRTKYHIIEVPLEFKVACAVYRLSIQQVLQIFVDHTSVYDSLTGEYSQGFSEATRTISSYTRSKVKKTKRSKAFLKCKEISIICLNAIFKEARNPRGKITAKRKRCSHFITAIYEAMERPHTYSMTLYLDENSPIRLTKDFCVLCELHNCYPKEYLEFFMGKISIAEAQANIGLKIKEHNFTFNFFMDIARGFGRDESEIADLTDTDMEFYERVEEMRLEIYNIRDLAERTAILRNFYLSHYQNINRN